MRARNLLALAAIATACSSQEKEPVAVGVNASFSVPQSLLSGVTSLTLTAYDTGTTSADGGSVTCNTATGVISNPSNQTPLATVPLGTANCVAPAVLCGSMQIAESNNLRVFFATGKSGTNTIDGCNTATINQSAEPLSITMERVIAASVCPDGIVEPTEQCDGAPAFYCNNSTCQTIEVPLSNGVAANTTASATTKGQKANPFFLWPSNGQFLAFFDDTASSAANAASTGNPSTGTDIGVRALDSTWQDLTNPQFVTTGEFFLPDGAAAPGEGMAGNQTHAVAVFAGSKYYVVFGDSFPSNADIHLRSMDTSFNPDQGVNAAITINGANGAGEPNTQQNPSIAASADGSKLFIAWEDSNGPNAGKVEGVLYTPATASTAAVYGAETPVSVTTPSTTVTVAAIQNTTGGFVAVYQTGSDVRVHTFNAAGVPAGNEFSLPSTANTRDQPSVASLADGSYAMVFAQHLTSSTANIMLQRFDANGGPISGDPVVVNNLSTANETSPRIASMTAVGGSYAITWLDSATGTVRGRYAANGENGATGFLFNNVDGQDNEFPVSAPGESPANPVVVSGGASGNVIFGWESAVKPIGIVGRLFPAPTQ